MSKKLFVFGIIFIILNSCKEDVKEKENGLRDKLELVESNKIISFELDALISNEFDSYSTQWEETKDENLFFSLLDGNNNRLLLYNTETGKLVRTVNFAKEGPGSVGQLLPNDRHLYISQDSILIFNSMAGISYLTDSFGKPYKKFSILDLTNLSEIFSYPHNFQEIHKIGQNIFFACTVSKLNPFGDNKMILKLNLNTGKVTKHASLPKLYRDSFWGESTLYFSYFTVNHHTNTILVSYPISNQVEVYDSTFTLLKRTIMDSDHVTKVNPYDEDVKALSKYTHDYNYFIKANEDTDKKSVFNKLFYDYNKRLYFRVNKLALDIEKVRKGLTGRDFTISIFDDNFEKIGETDRLEGENYLLGNIFIGDKGLYIGRKDLNARDEDHIHFSLFEAKKINE